MMFIKLEMYSQIIKQKLSEGFAKSKWACQKNERTLKNNQILIFETNDVIFDAYSSFWHVICSS
jgi:hypothetical protein